MAEIILGALCILAGVACALGAVFVFFANAMGGVTNAADVDNAPATWLALLAVAGVAGGLHLIL